MRYQVAMRVAALDEHEVEGYVVVRLRQEGAEGQLELVMRMRDAEGLTFGRSLIMIVSDEHGAAHDS